jgi:SAM-dependent methyltransferase
VTATPLAMYETALRTAARGDRVDLVAVGGPEPPRRLDAAGWCGAAGAGDAALLARCAGPTLDVGCGPGRLLVERARRAPALGIDVSAAAVRLARRRGGDALVRDVFDRVPAEGRWESVVLADGNVGIAGDPVALLSRCRRLVRAGGRVVAEVEPPGRPTWTGRVRLRAGGRHSAPFRWAYVGVDDIAPLAAAAGLRPLDVFTEAGRWFAALSPA